jgi:carboxylesterase
LKTKPNIFQHAELDGSPFHWKGNDTGILLTHGFTATSVEVRQMAEFLHAQGFTVAGPLLPGHGKTIDDMNSVSWHDWVNEVENFYLQIAKECERVFVIGESMGALLSIEVSVRHPEIAGAMLFSPALIVPKLWITGWIWPFRSFMYKKNVDESMPWQGFNVVPLHAANQLLKLQRYVKGILHNMAIPTLVFQGKLDRSINPLSSIEILEGISAEDKELIWLKESTHCILLDVQLPEVEEICLKFIQDHI